MWAAAPSPFSGPWPPSPVKLPHSFLSLAVSAKFRRPSRPENDHIDGVYSSSTPQEIGVMGQAVLTAFKSKPQQRISNSGAKPREEEEEEEQQQQQRAGQESKAKGQERQLSGSDVLRAWERATAEKAKTKTKPKQSKKKRDTKDLYLYGEEEEERAVDVAALRIKSEWAVRLEELENRLEELMLMDV